MLALFAIGGARRGGNGARGGGNCGAQQARNQCPRGFLMQYCMEGSGMTVDEEFNNSLFYFFDALRVAALDKISQRNHMGGHADNAAWEIQNDLLRNILALKYFLSKYLFLKKYLSFAEMTLIEEIIKPLEDMPSDSLAFNNSALDHTAWDIIRLKASNLISQLHDVEKKNYDFLYKKSVSWDNS